MAKNKVLIIQAAALALAAGVTLEKGTDGLNNAQLVKLVKDMKAEHPDAAAKVEEAERIAAEELATLKAAKKEKKIPPFYIADGKALTTKRGLLGPGREIKAEDLAGGDTALKAFVKTKHVIKS